MRISILVEYFFHAGPPFSLGTIAVVHEFLDGESPEAIVEHHPSLALDQVYGAIAFYLSHRAEVDAYLTEQDALWEQLRAESESKNAPLLQRLRDAKRKTLPLCFLL